MRTCTVLTQYPSLSNLPASHPEQNHRITAAQPRTAPQQKWQLLSKPHLCMVTRGTAGTLTGMNAPKSREDSKPGGSSCLGHDAHSEVKINRPRIANSRSQTPRVGKGPPNCFHLEERQFTTNLKNLTWPRAGSPLLTGIPLQFLTGSSFLPGDGTGCRLGNRVPTGEQ